MQCRAIPYEGKDPYIFVNYCHKDKASLYPVFEQMVRDGYRIWYDDANHAGDDWLDNIENHLEECKVVISFLSGNSSMSHSCKSEIVYAFKCKKKILPVLIDNTGGGGGGGVQMSHLHYLSACDYASLKELLEKIYVCPECKACRCETNAPMLRDIEEKKDELPHVSEETPQINLNNLKQIRVAVKRKKVPVRMKDIEVSSLVSDNTNSPELEKNKTEAVSVNEDAVQFNKACKPKKVIHVHAQIKKPEVIPSENSSEDNPQKPESKDIDVSEELFDQSEVSECSEMDLQQENESTSAVVTGLSNAIFETTNVASDICMLEETEYQNTSESEISEDSESDETVLMESRNLALLLHPAAQRAYILRKPQAKIGRSPIKCDIVIEGNDSISKYHADIIQYQKKIFLRDMNSANGTYINDNQIERGSQVPLSNPAVFQLSDETLILLSGALARQYVNMKRVSLLMNEKGCSVYLMDMEDIPLNRNNPWPDGTLSDTMIHRASHARICLKNDGYHLVSEAPARGNGTYLNEKRLNYQESRLLNPGDRIRLGETVLEYVSISI